MVILPASKQQQVSGLGLASFNYGANLIASKYWEDIELHANASYMHSPYNTNFSVGYATDNNRTNIVLLSLAPVWTVSRGFRVALDVGATTNPNMTEQYLSYYSMLGAIYSITDSLDLGLSYMRVALSYGATVGTQTAGSTRSEIGLTWWF
jgi:hypothetical protein